MEHSETIILMMTDINYDQFSGQGDQKPDVREQAAEYGVSSLTDRELIMLLLRCGQKGMPVGMLADLVLEALHAGDRESLSERIAEIPGMGPGKTTSIMAALELGKRFSSRNSLRIRKPTDIIPFLRTYTLENQEHFVRISLNSAHEIQNVKVISIGTLNKSLVHPREIFADPITEHAAAIIIAHNHPSGNPEPSDQDFEATEKVYEASRILGIQLLDHIIITKTDYFSFRESTDIFCT